MFALLFVMTGLVNQLNTEPFDTVEALGAQTAGSSPNGSPDHSPHCRWLPLRPQGDHAELIYMVKSGEVDVIRVLADGDEELLTKLGPRPVLRWARSVPRIPPIGVGAGGHRRRGHRLQTPESSVRRLHKH